MEWLTILFDLSERMGDRPFKVLILVIIWFGVRQLSRMSKSMEHLNTKIAVIVERTANHEKRISRLEKKK